MYAKCGKVEDAREVFDKMPERNIVSWNIMVAGYAQDGDDEKVFEFFSKMQAAGMKPDRFSFMSVLGAAPLEEGRQVHAGLIKTGVESHLSVGNALITMYAKCRSLDNASKVFMEMVETNAVSYTAMIGGYAQNGHAKEVLELFCQMQWAGIDPDQFTFASVISACANSAFLEQGKQLHTHIIKTGFELNVTVGNSLVTMYAKCGSIQEADKVFEEMPQRNVLSWTSIITGLAQNGRSKDALKRFEEMQLAGTKPNHITFVGVLSACSHAGLLDEGRHYFESMVHDHGIPQVMEHYACMVDLLGRAGLLDEAESFTNKMPLEPSVSVWRALLGACRIHGNVELGKCVAERILKLDPQDATAYVLLANIYAAAGRWAEVAKVRKTMKKKGIKKEAGCSWIVIKNRVHTFVAGDRSHPEMDEIYSQIENLMEQIKKAGYVPDTNFVLHDVEEEGEENSLSHHR